MGEDETPSFGMVKSEVTHLNGEVDWKLNKQVVVLLVLSANCIK